MIDRLGRWRAALAAMACTTLLVACSGSSASQPSVATLSTARPDSTGSAESLAADIDGRQAILDFAECMRKEGVDFPDPRFDADGRIMIGQMVGSSGGLDFQSEEFQAAQEVCGDRLEGLDIGADPERQAELQATLVEFAGCMRDNGIDMPDPQIGSGRGPVLIGGPDSEIDRQSPEFQAAFEACGDLLGDLPGPGTGQD